MAKRFKISFVCPRDDVKLFADLLIDRVSGFTCVPVEDKPVHYPVVAKPNVVRVPAQRRNVRGGAKASQTGPGRACISVFTKTSVAHGPDFHDALEEAGYAGTGWGSTVNKLLRECEVVRVGRGAYRRPTAAEALVSVEARKVEAGVS